MDTPTPAHRGLTGRITFRGRTNHWSRARITLKNTTTGETHSYEALTDEAGHYTIVDVPAGTYHALCYIPAYLKMVVTPVTVPVDGTVNVDFLNLYPGDLNDNNTVDYPDFVLFSGSWRTTGHEMPQ